MRKMLVLALILVTAFLGSPGGILAQWAGNRQVASVAGGVVDAAGRALINQRVELVRDGQVVQSTSTGIRGEWVFTNVVAGQYVARVIANGQVAGIRVSVPPGQAVTNTMIVTPSAAAPSAVVLVGAVGPMFGLSVATAALVVVTTAIVTTGS